tara:strand:+ start:3538 stop:4227 length:690 start_codon:yes stop_codon:yes gene_type:complete
MGYLDNSSITVDAVLTKKGREILKDGGNLNITSFTLSDTGVDYTLWNPNHPSGSAFYGEAIENLPMLEASVHAEYNLRNRLITLNQNTVALPSLILSNLDNVNGRTKTFNEGDEANGDIGIKLAGYTSTQNLGFYAVIQTPGIVTTTAQLSNTLSGTSHQFLSEQDIPFAQEYRFSGDTFTIRPVQQDEKNQTTNIYFVDIETGAYDYINVVNNITKNTRAVLSGGGIG